ncbi:pancreatic triacylglycerol lipase [Folsomia candida]|uniref:pancreatic triacylglycerol lipase n=1 Tax=Folsomia candida TaxID=158441 RepID=UPI000B8F1E80|nr:pancreatic triacylglycerol lipase [Folsomia candida]
MRLLALAAVVTTLLFHSALFGVNGFVFIDWKLFQLGSTTTSAPTPASATSAEVENEAADATNTTGIRSHRQVSNVTSTNLLDSPLKPLEDTGIQLSRKCFGDLGCLEISEDWFHFINRPVNLLPFDRDIVNTQFVLYTRNMSSKPNIVKPNRTELLETYFNPKLGVKFIIHGFIDTGFSSWVVKMAQSLVDTDVNVFAVDWGGGSLPLYTQATANCRLVGMEIAYFVAFLKDEFGVDPSMVHLIGHSLGAHVAGYAGEKISGLGRITGLDPAEPYFQNMPEFVRLDPSDAQLVDIIHTDSRSIILLGYGMSQPCGTIDFYPNDGFQQPGCEVTQVPLNLIQARDLNPLELAQREVFACNHNRAIYYFLESIKSKCQYIGHACTDYRSYLKGDCSSCGEDGSLCAIMGLDADKYYNVGNRSLVRFYVSTSKSPPYCLFHYRVSVQLAFPLIASEWVTGKLRVSLYGDKSSLVNVDLTPENNMRLDHGKNTTFLVQSPTRLGYVDKIKLEWQYNYNYYEFMSTCWAFLCNSKLFVKKLEIVDMDSQISPQFRAVSTMRLCGEEGTTYTGISSGGHAEFDRHC